MNKVNYYLVFPIFISLFIVLFFFFPKNPTGGESFDNIPTALAPLSLIREHNLDFNEFVQGQNKLYVNQTPGDTIYYFAVNSDRKVISGFPIFNGILLSPFYLVLFPFIPYLWKIDTFFDLTLTNLVFFISVLITVATSYVLFKTINAKLHSLKIALFSTAVFVFGTPVVSVSSRFVWQHTFGLFFIALLLESFHLKKHYNVILFSILATLCRPPALLICVPFLLVSLRSIYKARTLTLKKMELLSLTVSCLAISIQLFYSIHYLHNPFSLAPQYIVSRFNGNIVIAVLGLLFSPSRGLFFYSPIFVFSFLYLFKQLKEKRKTYFSYLVSILLFILLIARWDMWYGGWSLGYRLLLETVPILVLLMAEFLQGHHFELNMKSLVIVSALVASFIFNSQLSTNFGDCNFNNYPNNIDFLNNNDKLKRLWFDSPVFRCVRDHLNHLNDQKDFH